MISWQIHRHSYISRYHCSAGTGPVFRVVPGAAGPSPRTMLGGLLLQQLLLVAAQTQTSQETQPEHEYDFTVRQQPVPGSEGRVMVARPVCSDPVSCVCLAMSPAGPEEPPGSLMHILLR